MPPIRKPRLLIKGHELASRRLALFLSVDEFARKTGLSGQRIRDFENGNHPGTKPETARVLAKVLGCDPGDISEVVVAERQSA